MAERSITSPGPDTEKRFCIMKKVTLKEYIEQDELNPERNHPLDFYGNPELIHETESAAFFEDGYKIITAVVHNTTGSEVWSSDRIFYSDLTRDEAIALLGTAAIGALERENCEPTSRLMPEPNTTQEWVSKIGIKLGDYDISLLAYYYPENSDFFGDDGELIEDLSNINWQIDHYEIQD